MKKISWDGFRLVIVIAVGCLTSLFASPSAFAATTNTISLSPSTINNVEGSQFSTNLVLDTSYSVYSYSVDIDYNSNYLQFVSDTTSNFTNCTTNQGSSGEVNLSCSSMGLHTGTLSLASLNFLSVSSGNTNLTLASPSDSTLFTKYTPYSSGSSVSISPTESVQPDSSTSSPVDNQSTTSINDDSLTSTAVSSTPTSPYKQSAVTLASDTTTKSSPVEPVADKTQLNTKIYSNAADVNQTEATLYINSATAQSYEINYGKSPSLLTSSTDLASTLKSQSIKLSFLFPGRQYYYQIIGTTSGKITTVSQVFTFKTKGLDLSLTLIGKNNKPIQNQTVNLDSSSHSAKTNNQGRVSFSGIGAGMHNVIFKSGGKTYSQTLSVYNYNYTSGSAKPLNYKVVFSKYSPKSSGTVMAIVLIAFLLLILNFFNEYYKFKKTKKAHTIKNKSDCDLKANKKKAKKK